MVLITTSIEIAAPPSRVREVFNDFASWPTWTTGMIKAVSSHKSGTEVKVGDTLEVVLEGMTIEPTLLVNSGSKFEWRGSALGLFMGDHGFTFKGSEITAGGTTFVHEENFYRLLGLMMMLPLGFHGSTKKGFEKFNDDLKRRVEGEGK
ncbi:hypothetical protein CLAFUW4_06206 [Fulvia fulva]|uniref:Uncharacterized protein n=1 Tax=Passalora fulva TaxID=5499 RepID=A0A9Q8P8Z5_PASFU|nr:uncharacterized protein CLAFUR5_06350 [Fulvia fulva]KAK4624576.1 hypothetical protein CLAFUR4_06209 [Fulvia fulva]KAK4624845.1 hypothetical protein CLAFUR0_06213 [Fulvia fulva]UJO17729.1 hypothetical protein CLAFUR5_06350 [Fulvia fulva]WPV15044.1 hypothetical protein CLAFUW4_06206 [Fulvia fulva]WPV29462.1 hypothetical protein CLAFUW7_06202 [Fulvia fulva]